MLVTVNRIDTDEPVSKELDVTQEQIDAWQSGGLVQVVFPNLSISDREFLLTGLSEEEYDRLMGSDDEGLPLDDAEALASAGRGSDEDYRPDLFDDIPY
jgi:hypothetical protein